MKYNKLWEKLIKKEENRIRKEIEFKKQNPRLYFYMENFKSLLFWLLLICLVGCSSDKEDMFDYTEYDFTCSSTEKIYDISATPDDYVFEIEVLDYTGDAKSYPISKPHLKKEFSTNCSEYDKHKVLFLINQLTKRIQKLEQKIK